jgi:hypothetical protein
MMMTTKTTRVTPSELALDSKRANASNACGYAGSPVLPPYHIALARSGYNVFMPRAALFALLVVSVLNGSLQAQRATASFRGSSAARWPANSGFVGRRGFPNGFISSCSHIHHDGVGSVFVPYYVPYDEPFREEQPGADTLMDGTVPSVVIPQPAERQLRTAEPPAVKPQVIEIPGVAGSTAAKMLPPTIFILANGERLESRRFVLTASNLSVSVERQQRTIPLDMLDLNATISANHERGIDLRIPADRTEITLSF